MTETGDIRRKRLFMRATHRGMREMDLILGAWAEANLSAADAATLDLFEALLDEPDQDIYQWVSGQAPAPPAYAAFTAELSRAISGTPKEAE